MYHCEPVKLVVRWQPDEANVFFILMDYFTSLPSDNIETYFLLTCTIDKVITGVRAHRRNWVPVTVHVKAVL